MTPQALRRRVRELLDRGVLPLQPPSRTTSAFGSGRSCNVCDETIGADELQIEAHGADGRMRDYHEACYTVLVAERARRATGLGPEGPRLS